jgi:hypothetical protein
MNPTRLFLLLVATSALAGCSPAFNQIKADVPDLNVPFRYPLRVGFRVVGASTPMKVVWFGGSDGDVDAVGHSAYPYGQVLKDTATGALDQLFDQSEEAKPNGKYDLVIEMRLASMGWKLKEASFNGGDGYFRAIGSMRVLSQQGQQLWASTKNEVLQECEHDWNEYTTTHREKGVSGAISLLVKGWLTELEQSHVADRLAAKLGKALEPRVSKTGALSPPSATRPGSQPAKTPVWVQQIGGKKESRLAVLEFSGPLDDTVLMMLSDEVRGVALKAAAGHHCSVITRESMAVILKDMGLQCQEGDCEVETGRNIGADLVISGIVAKIEGTFVSTLKLHETARGALLASARATAPTALELIEAIKRSSAELFK